MKRHKKMATVIMSVLTVMALTVTSLAVFTDRFQSQAKVTAGTLDLTLTQNWTGDNQTVATNFRPGTAIKLNYTLANKGNLATDVRETFVISVDKAISSTNPEFELYAAKDVTLAADGTVTAITGSPLAYTAGTYMNGSTKMYKLTYQLTQFTLNGAGANGEKLDGLSDSITTSYVLVFKTNATNAHQNANVTIDYMAQGLQHYNTGAETWEDARVLVETTFGGETIKVVPALN